MIVNQSFYLVGYASGVAGVDSHAGEGPIVIQQSAYLAELINQGWAIQWREMLKPASHSSLTIEESIQQTCTALARTVSDLVQKKKPVCVVGGDHTSAIGTWSGVYDAVYDQGNFGLIWIDAHMDSHTPETSESGRIHGMPVACLLGHGYSSLTSILHNQPKMKPEHLCLIGVRSYERGEAELLKRLGVKVYFMDDVKQRGFDAVFNEALAHVKKDTCGFGLTLDIDALDPSEAPGVDVPEPNGIAVNDMAKGLATVARDPLLLATEIVEFDPSRDKERMTEKLIVSYLAVLARAKR